MTAAELVIATTRKAYPSLDVPFHSRWRHFVVGGVDRWAAIDRRHAWRDAAAARARRVRPRHRQRAARRRRRAGLAFRDPESGRADRPLRGAGAGEPRHVRDGRVLGLSERSAAGRRARRWQSLPEQRCSRGFQVSADNPLLGARRPRRPAAPARQTVAATRRRSSRATTRRVPAGSSIIWLHSREGSSDRRAHHPVGVADASRADLAVAADARRRCRSAIAGAIRR